jgi:hypothetical protein
MATKKALYIAIDSDDMIGIGNSESEAITDLQNNSDMDPVAVLMVPRALLVPAKHNVYVVGD